MTKIKICGLFRMEDMDYVNEAMPDYIGFVFAESRRQVNREQAKMLRSKLKDGIIPVGVFVDEPEENVAMLLEEGIIQIAQLHGSEDEGYIKKLKEMSGAPVIKAVSVHTKEDIRLMKKTSADFLLLDHGKGGTGVPFNWELIEKNGIPFFLAGGLSIGNITGAIEKIRPYAVDLSSGVETDGIKDKNKILEIVRRVRNV